jgi:N-acetylglucosaminyldiphosphoundecaprenol N-acetyl-beta-D-mannosaminyltransferase
MNPGVSLKTATEPEATNGGESWASERPARADAVRPCLTILGVPFDNVTTTEAIDRIEQMILSGQPHYLVTANVDFLVQAREDIELRKLLFEAHLVLCDGTPLLWASRLLGNALPERVAGSDLVPLLIALAEKRGYRLFFLGATPESIELAVTNLKRQHPALQIAGYYSPPFNKLLEMDHEEIRGRIVTARPDMLFVCFGCPKQEKWIGMHYRDLAVPVSAGVGATIDFLAGQVKRAPRWMQRSGTEWLYRLGQEPRRLFKRYVKDLWVFSGTILAQCLRLRSKGGRSESQVARGRVEGKLNWTGVRIAGPLDAAAVANGSVPGGSNFESKHLLIDLSEVTSVDSTGVGWLIGVQKRARAAGSYLVLVSPSQSVQSALALMRLEDFFTSAPTAATALEILEARPTEAVPALALPEDSGPERLAWRGEVTAANAAEVWRVTHEVLEATPRTPVIIDISAVRFLDSSGLGLMVRAKKLATQRGVEISFVGAQPSVRNVMHIARLEQYLLGSAKP